MFAMECEICNENVKYGEDYIKHLQDEHKANPHHYGTARVDLKMKSKMCN